MSKYIGIAFLITILVPALAIADIPDLDESSVEFAGGDIGPLVLFNVPGGTGSPFTAASDGSMVVDGTIKVTLRNAAGLAIANYPGEDLWLVTLDGGLVACTDPITAEASTDANGETFFVSALSAGGTSQGGTVVQVNGDAINDIVDMQYNSPDFDGNGEVGLPDLTVFTGDYFGAYMFRSDFEYDMNINLADLTRFTAAYGAACMP